MRWCGRSGDTPKGIVFETKRNEERKERRVEDTLGWNVAGRIVRQPRLMRMETRRVRGNEWKGCVDFGLEEATTLRMQEKERASLLTVD